MGTHSLQLPSPAAKFQARRPGLSPAIASGTAGDCGLLSPSHPKPVLLPCSHRAPSSLGHVATLGPQSRRASHLCWQLWPCPSSTMTASTWRVSTMDSKEGASVLLPLGGPWSLSRCTHFLPHVQLCRARGVRRGSLSLWPPNVLSSLPPRQLVPIYKAMSAYLSSLRKVSLNKEMFPLVKKVAGSLTGKSRTLGHQVPTAHPGIHIARLP